MGSPSLWQEQHPGRRFPPVEGSRRTEVCIVGAGVTGASCTRRLLEHGLDVTLVDGREIAGGASGRNGGFAVSGAGPLHASTAAALDTMADLAAELRIPQALRRTGSLWIAGEHEEQAVRDAVADARAKGIPAEIAPGRIPSPMRERHHVAAFFPLDAELMPALWVRTLAAAASDRGAAVHEHSPVTALETGDGQLTVRTPSGSVTAQAVVVACDGLVGRLVPELAHAVYPVRGQMVATRPLDRPPLDGPAHSQFGFMYFRPTPDGRIVLGGGRLEHLEAEYTDTEETTPGVQATLDTFLDSELGLDPRCASLRWAGIMGFSADRLPVVGEVPGRPGLHVSGGYSGVGNVEGFHCGRLVADLIATGAAVPAPYRASRFGGTPPDPREKAESRALARRLAVAS
jgi:gamma-glutamylputrescine oxidase